MNDALATVLVAMLGGAIRVSTPFLFVALGECLTEKSGRINLGLEGTLVLGAMVGYGVAFETGSPWLGVVAAGCAGTILGAILGILLTAITANGLNLLGISPYAFKMIIGAIILVAITLSSGGFAKLVGSRFAASQNAKASS